MRNWENCGLCAILLFASFTQTSGAQPPSSGDPAPKKVAPGDKQQPHLPGPDQPGPWDQDVLVYRIAADAQPGTPPEKLATFERAGVPTMARLKDGRLAAATQHFPKDDAAGFDKVAVRFSSDDGKTWTAAQVITMDGLPEGMRFPFDPTLVPLPDGRVRLYFTSRHEGPGKGGDAGWRGELPAIYSGISEDCIHFTFEPGLRFGVKDKVVIDCAAAIFNGKFHLYSPDNGSEIERPPGERRRGEGRRTQPEDNQPGMDNPQPERPRIGKAYHAVSDDGLTFTRVEDVTIEGQRRWLGNALSLPATGEATPARMIFIGTGGQPTAQGEPVVPPDNRPFNRRPAPPTRPNAQPQRGGIWIAESTDGQTWKLLDSLPVPGADPGAAKLPDGSWLVIVTGPPREGSPSARQRSGRRPNAP